ncbi:deoxynucleotide monophosphate kinase family protein [Robertmurraya andreesenii]|uniref:Dephospho-CoA kinase n=1 Tax=Anoxybacillus andreesenii TaxID=1325932 RepID=A0ABT9V1V8_9BACL|nr:adenylate kinase [Robertmurraya andreesenii]MDQ0154940.1 dephospho-CoA kinase [Robertmurraya andreesenii]
MKHEIEVNRKITVTKIAICGKLRSGKDTAAHHLYISHGFDQVAFGDALKRLAHETFPDVGILSKPRALYQTFGQLMREIDPDVWVRHAERKVDGIIDYRAGTDDHIGVVITDLRQPNEYAWAKANGFTIIRVTAPDQLRMDRAVDAGDDFTVHDFAHETEQHVDSFEVDYEVVNDGTVEELKAKVDAIMAKINGLEAVN